MLRTTLCALLVVSLPAVTVTQEGGDDLRSAVNAAIERGTAALFAQQELDGSWRAHQDGYAAGQTALCVYTLLKCDIPGDHQAIRRGVEYMRLHPSHKTYCLAVQLLALCELDPDRHRDWVEALVEELVAKQRGGGFAYPGGDVDLSNTQYATMGLRAAAKSGVKVSPRVWDRLVDCAVSHQEGFDRNEPAGFFYRRDSYPTGSMTTAGLTILAIARSMGASGRELERSLAAGSAWLEREVSLRENPKRNPTYQYYYYWMYGLERVAGLLELETIGGRDWYREGARVLLEKQNDKGRWGAQQETCFALLFLARATAPVSGIGARGLGHYVTKNRKAGVVLRATGDAPLTLWIDSFGKPAELEWEGEEGQGPRVLAVSYECVEAGETVEVLAEVEGDGERPAAGKRFAVQHTFPSPGKRTLVAVAHVLPPGATSLAEAVELRSPPLEVTVSQAWNEELLSYATDPERNLLRGLRVKTEASSSLSDAFKHTRAVDGRHASAWLSADTDATPWLRLELNKAVKANRLLLSHTFNPADPDAKHTSRIQRVALRINNSKTPIEFELVPDDWRKTVIPFRKAQKVRELELQVIDVRSGGTETLGVGFAEVELQFVR